MMRGVGRLPFRANVENDALDRDAVTLASAQSPSSIRTLQATEEFDELLATTSGVVLVDFYADWCGPCRKQSKVLHEVEEFAASQNAKIIKVNVDEHPELAKKYQVSSLPTLLALQEGDVRHKKIGLTKQDQLEAMLRQRPAFTAPNDSIAH